VDESAKDVASSDASRVGFGDRGRRFGDRRGTALIEGSVRPEPVVMTHVFGEDDFEMAAAEDEEPVQAFPADGADKPLSHRVCARRPDGLWAPKTSSDAATGTMSKAGASIVAG
jgi:hypothetical protein